MIKITIAAILFILGLNTSHAEEYLFLVHRFCDILLDTNSSAPYVEIKIYPKTVEQTEILFRSKLKLIGDKTYESSNKIRFKLKQLQTAVIHDANRHINSGNWQLDITGTNSDFQRLKNQLVPISTFRTPDPDSAENPMPDMVYYGVLEEGK